MQPDARKITDILEWDVANWKRILFYWDGEIKEPLAKRRALEIGGQNGGLSLYLALKGCEVICSDFKEPTHKAREIMRRYGVSDRVTYVSRDVTNIADPPESFDIVVFKSVLGHVGIHKGAKGQQQAIDEIYRVLKPNGILLFAENLRASVLHQFFRTRFVKWGHVWRYPTVDEMRQLIARFSTFRYETYGYFACFGRAEWQKRLLSMLDRPIDLFLSEDSRYIIYGYARK